MPKSHTLDLIPGCLSYLLQDKSFLSLGLSFLIFKRKIVTYLGRLSVGKAWEREAAPDNMEPAWYSQSPAPLWHSPVGYKNVT
jgi:hypothetical protein